MSLTEKTEALAAIPGRYANPPREIVSHLPRKTKGGGTINIDFVGHADITLQVIEADPEWTWEPFSIDPETGGPKITRRLVVSTDRNGQLHEEESYVMWGRFLLLGNWMIEVGTCPVDQPEPEKELVGDFLRRAAMRRGFATKLWSKTDREAGISGNGHKVETVAETSNGHSDPRPAHANQGSGAAAKAAGEPTVAAIKVMAEALECDDPVNAPPPEVTITPWMWQLAGETEESLDNVPWEKLGKVAGVQPTDLLDRAQGIARKLKEGSTPNAHVPDRLDEIHGAVAVELRRFLLSAELSF